MREIHLFREQRQNSEPGLSIRNVHTRSLHMIVSVAFVFLYGVSVPTKDSTCGAEPQASGLIATWTIAAHSCSCSGGIFRHWFNAGPFRHSRGRIAVCTSLRVDHKEALCERFGFRSFSHTSSRSVRTTTSPSDDVFDDRSGDECRERSRYFWRLSAMEKPTAPSPAPSSTTTWGSGAG